MKTLKYLISIVVAVVLLVSCHKTPKTADYRDQWMGEYAYVTDRDGGMEGVVYADKADDGYVNIYISGIGELKKMVVAKDGRLSLAQQDYYLCNSLTGRFTEDSLCFEYYVQSEPRTKVTYRCKKINGNTSENRDYPVEYRDKWVGKYTDISSTLSGDQIYVAKISYNRIGIFSVYPWEIIFNVAEDGKLSVVKPGSEWGNYNEFEGEFIEDRLTFHFQTLTQAGVVNKSFVYQKL